MPNSKTQNSKLKTQNHSLKHKTFAFLIVLFTFAFLALSTSTSLSVNLPNGLLFNLSAVRAQDTSCDLCGWCGANVADKPTDWEKCMKCLFPSTNIPTPVPPAQQKKPGTNEFYPSHPQAAKNWTVVGCLDTAPGGFVIQIYKVIVSVAAGFALLAFIYGGFTVLTAGGNPQKVSGGKNIIMGAVFGLLLVLFSVFLLRFIGFEVIKIPGFS